MQPDVKVLLRLATVILDELTDALQPNAAAVAPRHSSPAGGFWQRLTEAMPELDQPVPYLPATAGGGAAPGSHIIVAAGGGAGGYAGPATVRGGNGKVPAFTPLPMDPDVGYCRSRLDAGPVGFSCEAGRHGHTGPHWAAGAGELHTWDGREPGAYEVDPDPSEPVEKPATFQLPLGPPTGSRVTNGRTTWERQASGDWLVVRHEAADGTTNHGHGALWSWAEILTANAYVTQVPLTDEELELEAIYGPAGARWGDPDTPCPYLHWVEGEVCPRTCSMGVGHVGYHRDKAGNPLGVTTEEEGPVIHPNVTAADLDTPCDCGHPEAHTRDCARYPRVSGQAAQPDHTPLPAAVAGIDVTEEPAP